MPSINSLRAALGDFADDKSDEQLLQLASDALGVSAGQIASHYNYEPTSSGISGLRTGAAIDQYQAGLYGLGEALTGSDWMRKQRESNEFSANVASERARAQGAVDTWADVNNLSDFGSYVGGLAIQSAPYAAEALAGGLITRGAMSGTRAALAAAQEAGDVAGATRAASALSRGQRAGAVAASYPSSTADILQNQREQAGTTDLGAAMALGVPYAAANAFGIEGALARGAGFRSGIEALDLMSGLKGGAARMAASGGIAALSEGGSEVFQEGMNQFGRMAVDPNAQFLSDEAMARYKESAIGGAILGGAASSVGGGWRRSEGYKPGGSQVDLLGGEAQTQTQGPVLGLTYSPLAGTPTVFPDGSVALNGEQELQGRYGADVLVDRQNQQAPAGATATVPAAKAETPERQANKVFRDTYNILPTPYNKQVVGAIEAEGFTWESPEVEGVRNFIEQQPMNKKRFEKAMQMVDEAVIAQRKGAANVSPAVAPTGPATASVGTGGAVAPASVATGGLVSQQPVGPVAGISAAPSAAPAAPVVAGASAQQPTPVTSETPRVAQAPQAVQAEAQGQQPTTRGAAGTTELIDTSDDALEIARATGNASVIEAMREDAEGLRVDQRDFGDSDMDAVVAQSLAKSKNKDRDSKILKAYLLARKSVPEGYKGDVAAEVAAQFGITPARVRQIGNPQKLADVAVGMGFDQAQVFTHLGIESATKAVATKLSRMEGLLGRLTKKKAPTQTDMNRMAALSNAINKAKASSESGDMASALKAVGIEGEGSEVFAGTDDARYWQEASTAGSQLAVELVETADAIEALRTAAEDLRRMNMTDAAEAAAAKINELTAKYEALAASATKPKSERKAAKAKTEAAQVAAEEKSAAKEAEAAKYRAERAAKLAKDRNGLAVGDTVMNPKLGTGVVKSFAGDGDSTTVTVAFQSGQTKELSVKLAKLEKTNAVQVQSPTEVSVRQGAEAGQRVGAEVRRAEKPASQGEVTVRTPQEQYQEVTAGFPVPAWEDLTGDQQSKLSDLAYRDQLNLAAVNRFVAAEQPGQKFGKDGRASKPYTARELIAELRDFVRTDVIGRKLMVVDTIADLLRHPDKAVRAVGAAMAIENAYGVAVDGRAFLIADRINKGSGRAKFMHEVGTHLGLEKLLPKKTYDSLVAQIKKWTESDADTDEVTLAARAQLRVENAQTNEQDRDAELLAYFIEEAVEAGIDPTADLKGGPLSQWFRTLWAAFKVAVRKLGFKPETLTAQDIVDLAFGAARLEMAGTFHGTAAQFRKFSNKFMGSGEGAQAYGWGTYLAQKVGIAKGYWAADVERKAGIFKKPAGALMRVDTALDETNTLDWDKTLDVQPDIEAKLEAMPMGLKEAIADQYDQNVEDLGDLTGEDLYRALTYLERSQGLVSELSTTEIPAGQAADKVASEFLDSLGIGGLKFLDATSRGGSSKTISFDGDTYTGDQLREARIKAAAAGKMDDVERYILLSQIRREGVDAVKATLKNKIASFEEMFFTNDKESTERFGLKFDEAKARADAKALAKKSVFQVQQLEWLEANESKIAVQEKPRTRNLVVFNDKNIFRVGSAIGADRQSMKFGKSMPSQGLIDRNVAKLPKQLQQPAKNIVGALGDLTGRGLDYVVFTNALVNRAVEAGMPAARRFATALANSKAAAAERERAIEKIADMYADVEEAHKGSGAGSVNEFLFESTRTGKWGYDNGSFKADPEMKAMFDALGPKAQAFVKAVFKNGDDMLSQKKKIVLDATNSEYDAMIAIAKQNGDNKALAALKAEKVATLDRFKTLFKVREGLPYAPIKRSGAWRVVSKSAEYRKAVEAKDTKAIRELEKSPEHYQVSFVDSKWEARNLEAKIAEAYPTLTVTVARNAEELTQKDSATLMPAITRLRAKVDEETGSRNANVLNVINQLYLEALAESSARKSEMRRRGISGEVDMLQSFTTQGRADANFISSVEYSPEIQEALQQLHNQSRDDTRQSEIFRELSARYVGSLDYNVSPWINKLTGLSSKYFLATSPGYYLQNLTQPFMMSVPAMAGKHDYAKVGQALWQAYSELGPLFKNTKLFDQQFDFTQVPADVKDAVNELVKRGKIDIGLATEINEYKVDADSKLTQTAQKLNKGMRLAVQKTEAINRLSTAMAAYRLELERTGSESKAVEYADRILTETHGDYTAFNAPRIFNTNFGKVALQFRKFQLVQIGFYAKLISEAFSGDPALKKAALRTLGFSLAHSGVFAGVLGLPGYAAVAALAGMLFGDDDEPYDLTEEMRKALGPEWSQLIMRGAPTLVGMDLSGKIGSGNMLSIAPFADIDLTTQAGVYQAIGTVAGGAAGGMTARMLDGLGLMMGGDIYRGLEQTMPKGIGDMLKAGRIAGSGLTRRNGDVILGADDVSSVSMVWAAMGLPSSKVSETYQAMQYSKDLEKNFTERASKIKNQYAKAYRDRDTQAMTEARQAWTKLQAARKRNDLKPQPMSSLLRAPQEQGKREKKLATQID